MGRRKHWRIADDTGGEILCVGLTAVMRACFPADEIGADGRRSKTILKCHGKVAMFSFRCTDVTP